MAAFRHIILGLMPIFLLPNFCFSQKQDRQLLAYNVGLGCLASGIGAVINKPKNGDWKKYFVRGVWQGGIGGALSYSGKKTLHLINKLHEPGYAWPAKIFHAAGTSIIENAALNEPFLQNWNIDIGLVRLDFSPKNRKPFKARLLTVSLYAFAVGSTKGKMDWPMTFRTGTISFYSPDYIPNNGFPAAGLSYGRGLIYTDRPGENRYAILAHENVHIMQYRDFMLFNNFAKPLEKKLKPGIVKTIFSKYVYLDIPYFQAVYGLEGRSTPLNRYGNFFEFEAERFATNRYIPR